MADQGEKRKKIKMFIISEFPLAKQLSLSDDESLLESEVIDSMGILEVVTFLEREFQIAVTDEELTPDNFDSISSLVAFVEKKTIGETQQL